MKPPTDQLTVLEAIALGYALAGREQQAKIFAMIPASEWVGPLAGLAQCLADGRTMGLGIIGCASPPLPAQAMKAIVEELIVAETKRKRMAVAEEVGALARRMVDPQMPGGGPTESEIETILTKARGLYEDQRKAKAGGAGQQARSSGTHEVPGTLVKAATKAVRSHQATGASAPKV